MKKRLLVAFISILLSLTAIYLSFFFDVNISLFFASLRNHYTTVFLLGLTFLSNIIILFFFLTSLFLWQEHKRRWIFPLWLSLLFSIVVSYILKILIARLRPFLFPALSILAITFKNNYLTWNSSFPSFHAVLVFSALPILSKEFRKLKYIWLIFAVIIALSRVYLGAHFFSDVLCGALIGYLIGLIFVKIEEKYKLGEKLT